MLKRNIGDVLGFIEKLSNQEEGTLKSKENEMLEEFKISVACHEYGHSLFRSQENFFLEETKATLNHFVYLHDQFLNNGEELTEEKAYNIVYVILTQIKHVKRLNSKDSQKYVFNMKVLFYHLIESQIISFDEGNKEIHIVEENLIENLKKLITDLKDILYDYKEIYENNDREREQQLIDFYEKNTKYFIENIYDKVVNMN